MKIIECEQRSPEWFSARLGRPTASCFGAIMATNRSGGESAERRNYRAKLVVERLTGRPVDTYATAAMRQGTEREPLARAAYEVQTGEVVTEVGFILHDEIEAGASPDGLVDERGVIEIKAPELATHLDNLRSPALPARYAAQVQGQLWLAERDWCDFVSFNPDFPEHLQLVIRRVERDEAYIKRLADAVAAFMEEVRAEEAEVRALPIAA